METMYEYITCGLFALLAIYIICLSAAFVRERRRAEKKQREIINSLKVGQVWHSEELVPVNPFRQPVTFYSRITDIRRNHHGDVWVEFCYRDQPEVLKTLPADRFIDIYPILSES